MICFFPDGSIQTKVNICSCNFCLQGDFISCTTEKGNIFQLSTTEASDDESDDSDDNEEYGDNDDDGSNHELYELRAESVNSIVSKDSTIDCTHLQMPLNCLPMQSIGFWRSYQTFKG